MPSLINRYGPTEFESVTLGAPTLEMGIAYLFEKTGLLATPLPSPADAWSRSAILLTQAGSVIEVLAPDPGAKTSDLIAPELAALKEPQLVFWTVNVRDFSLAAEQAKALDHPVERMQDYAIDVDGRKQAGTVGRLGPGENWIRPVLSFTAFRPVYPGLPQAQCVATGFHLTDWEVPPLNRMLDGLDMRLRATPGAPSLRLDLETPNGSATLESGDWIKGGAGQTLTRLVRLTGRVFRRQR